MKRIKRKRVNENCKEVTEQESIKRRTQIMSQLINDKSW